MKNSKLTKEIEDAYLEFAKVDVLDLSGKGEKKWIDAKEVYRKKLESIENPIQFYNYVKQSNILSDLFLYYRDKATSQTYGGFVDNQEAFDTAIFEQLGINPKGDELEERFKIVEEFNINITSADRLLKIDNKYNIALSSGRKQLGIFTSGDKVVDYIMREKDNLSGNIKVKVLKSKR